MSATDDSFFTDQAVDEVEHSFESCLLPRGEGDAALLGLEEELGSLDWSYDGVYDAAHYGPGELVSLCENVSVGLRLLYSKCSSRFKVSIFLAKG